EVVAAGSMAVLSPAVAFTPIEPSSMRLPLPLSKRAGLSSSGGASRKTRRAYGSLRSSNGSSRSITQISASAVPQLGALVPLPEQVGGREFDGWDRVVDLHLGHRHV